MGRPAAQSSQVPQTSLVPLSTLLPTSVASTQGTSFWLYSNSAEGSQAQPAETPLGAPQGSGLTVLSVSWAPGPLKGQEEGTQLPKSQALQDMY